MSNVISIAFKKPKEEMLSIFGAYHMALLFSALYVSEGWYDKYKRVDSVHAKARAMVLFDRVLNQELDRFDYKD